MYKIAISGKAGSGKDTLSNVINAEFCIGAPARANADIKFARRNIAFADPIKEMIMLMFPYINREHVFGSSKFREEIIKGAFKDDKPLTIRQLLQDWGEGCKKYNPKIWIEAFDNTFQKYLNQKVDLVIASDLRFIDEFNYLKTNGFYLIRLIRDDVKQINHISETQQAQIKDEDFDKVILNNGTLEDLRQQVNDMVKILKA